MPPLRGKGKRFAELYGPLDGVAAARAAEYSGSAAALAVTASRLLDDPRVQARLRERGVLVPPKSGSGPGGRWHRRVELDAAPAHRPAPASDAVPDDIEDEELATNLRTLAEIRDDPTLNPRDRRGAADQHAKLVLAYRKAQVQAHDPLPILRTKIAEIIAKKRARERERG